MLAYMIRSLLSNQSAFSHTPHKCCHISSLSISHSVAVSPGHLLGPIRVIRYSPTAHSTIGIRCCATPSAACVPAALSTGSGAVLHHQVQRLPIKGCVGPMSTALDAPATPLTKQQQPFEVPCSRRSPHSISRLQQELQSGSASAIDALAVEQLPLAYSPSLARAAATAANRVADSSLLPQMPAPAAAGGLAAAPTIAPAVGVPEGRAAAKARGRPRKRGKGRHSEVVNPIDIQRILAEVQAEEAAEAAAVRQAVAAAAQANGPATANIAAAEAAAAIGDSTGSKATITAQGQGRRGRPARQAVAVDSNVIVKAASEVPIDVVAANGASVAVAREAVIALISAAPRAADVQAGTVAAAVSPAAGRGRGRGRGRRVATAAMSAANVITDTLAAVAAAEAPAGQVVDAEAAPAAPKRKRTSRNAAAADLEANAESNGTAVTNVAAAAANAAAAPKSSRNRKNAAKPAVADSAIVAHGTAAAAADPEATEDEEFEPPLKPKRARKKKEPAVDESGNPIMKPVRRTKKVIAAEVQDAARLGQFGELTSLLNKYSHINMFTSSSNMDAWTELVAEAAQGRSEAVAAAVAAIADAGSDGAAVGDVAGAAAAELQRQGSVSAMMQVDNGSSTIAKAGFKQGLQPSQQLQQQSQQQGDGIVGNQTTTVSDGRALCRQSGLGSFRQQVWLHTVMHKSGSLQLPSLQLQSSQQLLASQQQPEAANTTDRVPVQDIMGVATDADVLQKASQQQAAITQQQAAGIGTITAGSQQQTDSTAKGTAASSAAAIPPQVHAAEVRLLPNLGYACLCMTMRQYDVFNSRDCVKKTRDAADGLAKVSQLALANARDLVPLILWNEAHGIRLFRLSSCILPWMTSYKPEELADWLDIQRALRAAGDLAKTLGHRLTFHPSEYCKIAGEREAWVTQSVQELEVHSRIFDEMGFLPATPFNKINIHVGGTYGGDKEATLRRFSAVVNERLSPNCKARLTVENDDRASQYSVADLQLVHQLTGIPIVFDFHHWKFCQGGQTQEEAFLSALATWPAGVRPIVHWSESPEEPGKRRSAHSGGRM
eukprot:GHRR01014443.1.p1 GENE.GHRR01014443.1~~GHRR01014443.1.p1  ORF type:complete len:1060 (+),score=468.43 GHRR01014443.1:1060-4239(+)